MDYQNDIKIQNQTNIFHIKMARN